MITIRNFEVFPLGKKFFATANMDEVPAEQVKDLDCLHHRGPIIQKEDQFSTKNKDCVTLKLDGLKESIVSIAFLRQSYVAVRLSCIQEDEL